MTDVVDAGVAESVACAFLAGRVRQLEGAIRRMGFVPPAVDWSVFELPAGSVSLADAVEALRERSRL